MATELEKEFAEAIVKNWQIDQDGHDVCVFCNRECDEDLDRVCDHTEKCIYWKAKEILDREQEI